MFWRAMNSYLIVERAFSSSDCLKKTQCYFKTLIKTTWLEKVYSVSHIKQWKCRGSTKVSYHPLNQHLSNQPINSTSVTVHNSIVSNKWCHMISESESAKKNQGLLLDLCKIKKKIKKNFLAENVKPTGYETDFCLGEKIISSGKIWLDCVPIEIT